MLVIYLSVLICILYLMLYIDLFLQSLFRSLARSLARLIDIGQVGRGIANGQGDRGSIPRQVIPKTQKMVLDTSLLNTQQYMARSY